MRSTSSNKVRFYLLYLLNLQSLVFLQLATKKRGISRAAIARSPSVRKSTVSVSSKELTVLTCANVRSARILKDLNLAPSNVCSKSQRRLENLLKTKRMQIPKLNLFLSLSVRGRYLALIISLSLLTESPSQ
jgi:hypothetical protein